MKDALRKPGKRAPRLFNRIAAILEEARASVARTVNTRMVIAYWLVGREIVQEEQGGKKRAGYGDALLEDLSRRLTERYGRGYSPSSLADFRRFHQVYANRLPEIFHTTCGKSPGIVDAIRRETRDELLPEQLDTVGQSTATPDMISHETRGESLVKNAIHHEPRGELPVVEGFSPDLSWTHCCLLMRVENVHARSFYEIEAIRGRWSTPDLERQINSLLFERMLKSHNKKGVMALARKGSQPQKLVDILKDPFVLEFLDLPEGHELVESRASFVGENTGGKVQPSSLCLRVRRDSGVVSVVSHPSSRPWIVWKSQKRPS